MCHFMKVMNNTFGRIQDTLLKYHICLHYTLLHYSTQQISAQSRVKIQINAKDWLPGESFLRQKVFFLWVVWSNYGNLDQLSTQKSNQNIFEKNKVFFRPDLNTFRGIWCLPDQFQTESWHQTDCCNMVSEI